MLSHHDFNGNFTLPVEMLSCHLAYEWERNQDTFVNRPASPPSLLHFCQSISILSD